MEGLSDSEGDKVFQAFVSWCVCVRAAFGSQTHTMIPPFFNFFQYCMRLAVEETFDMLENVLL